MKTVQYESTPLILRREREANALEKIALAVLIIFAVLLFAASLFYGARLRPSQYHTISRVDIFEENELTNMAAFVLMFFILRQLKKVKVNRRLNRIIGSVVLSILLIGGLFWVFSIKGKPTCDALVLYNILMGLRTETIVGMDLSQVGNAARYYMVSYPFQCGFLSYMDMLLAITGKAYFLLTLRGLNVIWMVSADAAILLITQELFQDDSITFVTILLLGACVQPILYSTACYSQIPSFAASTWGMYAIVRYLKNRKWQFIGIAAILLGIAVFVKPNAWIIIAALSIALVLDTIRNRSWVSIAAAVTIVALAVPAPKLIQKYYETQFGTSFGTGYPLVCWTAMSLQSGDHTTGWYDHSYNVELRDKYGEDMEAVKERSYQDIQSGLQQLVENPQALFWYCLEKNGAQWLEPTFMSVWATNGGAPPVPQPQNAFATFIYSDTFDAGFRFVMRFYIILLYGGLGFSALRMLRKRTEAQMILPLIILGGILYHMLFEAQSRYALNYIPLFCPMAAYGILSVKLKLGRIRTGKLQTNSEEASGIS